MTPAEYEAATDPATGEYREGRGARAAARVANAVLGTLAWLATGSRA